MGRHGDSQFQDSRCNFANSATTGGTRLTIEQAQEAAAQYIAQDSNLQISEIMEFNANFYIAVTEKDSGRGAMELLVNPYSGIVTSEHGPNRMWNEKYGHMGSGQSAENSLTLQDTSAKAQVYLDKEISGATVKEDGIAFYGYYTFDYEKDDQVAGMLSVDGNTGEVWLHTWHGEFIQELEITK